MFNLPNGVATFVSLILLAAGGGSAARSLYFIWKGGFK